MSTLLQASLTLTMSFCSPVVQKQSYRISISQKITLRPWSSEKKQGHCATQNTKHSPSPLCGWPWPLHQWQPWPPSVLPTEKTYWDHTIIELPPLSCNTQSSVSPYFLKLCPDLRNHSPNPLLASFWHSLTEMLPGFPTESVPLHDNA